MLSISNITATGTPLQTIKHFFKTYQQELDEDLCFQSFEKELDNPLAKYVHTGGCILMAYFNNEPCGCVALLPLKEQGVCEMKRLYVQPAFRKEGIGRKLTEAVLAEAKQKGFYKMVLDTLDRLQPAIALYKSLGFEDCSAYYKNPLQGVVYMQKELLNN
jgi:putative acetyltransferase